MGCSDSILLIYFVKLAASTNLDCNSEQLKQGLYTVRILCVFGPLSERSCSQRVMYMACGSRFVFFKYVDC